MSRDESIGEILVQPDELEHRVRELGAEISRDYAGRDLLLIVEDIVDSGLTLQYLMRTLETRGPASLEVCALLTKPERRLVETQARYVGFEIPDKFAIGYGLDYSERYRNLPYVATLQLEGDR